MPNIAFFIKGIGSLKGGGGAERFFADFFEEYQKFNRKKFGLYFIIDQYSVKNLNEVGKLRSAAHLLQFRIVSNRFKKTFEALQFYILIITRNIKIIHIPLYDLSYLPLLKAINHMPSYIRPKLAINIVNCYAAPALEDESNRYHQSITATYLPLFKQVEVDGYFCWNKNFESYLTGNRGLTYSPSVIKSITSRFSDVENYYPELHKKNWIVFASRLDQQKHPEWILEAVARIHENNPDLLKSWTFKICGAGPMRSELINYSEQHGISGCVEFHIEGEMHKILNFSKIYVSCQDYDNFPSLTMTEAMASGNAIIARNVGQTELFVKKGINGLLVEPDNAEGLSSVIISLISDPELIVNMGNESLRSIQEVHNVPNFINQIHNFWEEILV